MGDKSHFFNHLLTFFLYFGVNRNYYEKYKEVKMTQVNSIAANIAPMFQLMMKEEFMAKQITEEISVFEVKELYDAAYEQKAQGAGEDVFQKMMAEAVKMDMAYRRQLSQKDSYRYIERQSAKGSNTANDDKTKVA